MIFVIGAGVRVLQVANESLLLCLAEALSVNRPHLLVPRVCLDEI